MREIILQLKEKLDVKSDEAVARAIGVSLNAVSMWKAGKRNPGNLAKNKINELLKKHAKGAK